MGIFNKKSKAKDVSVSFGGPTDEELKKQMARYYAENKESLSEKRKAAKAELETAAGRDKKWREYSEESRKHAQDRNFGNYRNTRYNMAMLLKKESKHSETLQLLTEVVFWDLTGCGNSFDYPLFLEIGMQFLFPYEKSTMKLAPGVVREVGIVQRKLNLSDEQLSAELLKAVQGLTAPVQFFTYAEIVDIFFWTRENDVPKLKKAYSAAKKRFDPKHPNVIT
jgi:hypothetical protein